MSSILWLSWKDHNHPEAGGAEVVLWQIAQRLVAEGHQVTILTCGYDDAPSRETIDKVDIVRVGKNRYAHSFVALGYYIKHLRGKFDLLIEEVNAAPYFAALFEHKAKKFMFYHQMEQKVWFCETRAPLSHIGQYILEPAATRLLSAAKVPVITISESTKQELAKFGFKPERTAVISEGLEIEPVADLKDVNKFKQPTLLSLGAMRAMKRTLEHIKVFELAKKQLPNLQLKVAGSSAGEYGEKVMAAIAASPYKADIEYLGRVSKEHKIELMRRSHIILQTAIKEGWGLTVTEANSQGTLAAVYNVEGLRDSVKHGTTGIIGPDNDPQTLANEIVRLIGEPGKYRAMQREGWQWSKQITFNQSYADFKQAVGLNTA